jgi:uncharacterized membrane protein
MEGGSDAQRGRYERDSVEFGRVLAFSDGVFAIAATLLVVTIAVPALASAGDAGELLGALREMDATFVSFAVGFAVIGRYWFAHHQFFGLLQRLDARLVGHNLVYLAFIAFLPFPTALLGTYFENPISIAAFAVIVAAVSGLEVLLLRTAHHDRLLRRPLPDDVYRWALVGSASPVALFALSIPVAFLSTALAVAVWFAAVPLGLLLDRSKPAGADELLS